MPLQYTGGYGKPPGFQYKPPGSKPAAAPPPPYKPPSPAAQVPNPPAQPFLTGQQTLDKSGAQTDHDQKVQALIDALASFKLNMGYQQKAIERGRVQGVSNTQDDAAARGISQSSIKDGTIYDINSQAATQQQQLNDQLSALNTSTTSQINMLDQALQNVNNSFNQMAVENASQIDTGYSAAPQPKAAPSNGQLGTLGWFTNPANGQQYQIIKSGGTTYHVYKDGHKVKV